MRAALSLEAGRPLVIEDVELRGPHDGEVLVEIEAAAMCTTDQHGLDGRSRTPRPYITGHSAIGTVLEVGASVSRTRVGDRVVVAGTIECGACYACLRGTPSQCDELWRENPPPHVVARRADGDEVRAEAGAGTYAERMVYREGSLAVVDSSLPADDLALLGCGGLSGFGAVVEVGRVAPGDTVVIVGCGHLGLWMIQTARLIGASRIIAVEIDAERLALASAFGATDLILAGDDPVAQVLDATDGRGADVGLEASGSVRVMEQLFQMTRRGGVLVLTSMEGRDSTVTFPGIPLSIYGRQIRSSQSGGGFLRRDVPRIARLLEGGRLTTDGFVGRVYGLDDINHAVEDARSRRVLNAVIRPHD